LSHRHIGTGVQFLVTRRFGVRTKNTQNNIAMLVEFCSINRLLCRHALGGLVLTNISFFNLGEQQLNFIDRVCHYFVVFPDIAVMMQLLEALIAHR